MSEEALYAEASREIKCGVQRDGLWAKALANNKMDAHATQAAYIHMRVQAILILYLAAGSPGVMPMSSGELAF